MRVVLNGVLAFLCFSGGAYLLQRGSIFWPDRWHPQTGIFFAGPPLYLLALGLFFLGAFVAAVTLDWIRGTLPMPDSAKARTHPVYKGQIIVRYWYLVAPALILVLSAFVLATHAPNQSLRQAPESGAGVFSN
jgi:hypothetical protein